MNNLARLIDHAPLFVRRKLEKLTDDIDTMLHVSDKRVAAKMAPSAIRGLLMQRGRHKQHLNMCSQHKVHFDLTYERNAEAVQRLYRLAVEKQWDANKVLDWGAQVDPENVSAPILNEDFFPLDGLKQYGITLNKRETMAFNHSVVSWFLSQFLHAEQGALYAASQVVEGIPSLDGKLYGATQVMDEARHVEIFDRYVDSKLNKRYQINDNLYVIIDELLTDSRWDMKFLGMQIMVEGLALGSFATLHNNTNEPLLKSMLRYVIQDEARHVRYGILSLKDYYNEGLSYAEQTERQNWAYEVAVLMKNRFLAHELFEEWFEGQMTRQQWNNFVETSPAMRRYRHQMFRRLIPNLKHIGLMPDRLKPHYEKEGLWIFTSEKNLDQLNDTALDKDLH